MTLAGRVQAIAIVWDLPKPLVAREPTLYYFCCTFTLLQILVAASHDYYKACSTFRILSTVLCSYCNTRQMQYLTSGYGSVTHQYFVYILKYLSYRILYMPIFELRDGAMPGAMHIHFVHIQTASDFSPESENRHFISRTLKKILSFWRTQHGFTLSLSVFYCLYWYTQRCSSR